MMACPCALCYVWTLWYVVNGVMSLSSAVYESPQLPVTVRCVAPAVNHQSRDQLHGQQLTIRQLYDSAFLLANPIHNGMHCLLIAFSVRIQQCTVTGVPWREMTLRPRALPEIVHSDDGSLHTWHSISCNFAHERKSQSAFYTYRGRWGSILSYSPLDPPLRKTHGPIAIAISRSVRRMSVLANISKSKLCTA